LHSETDDRDDSKNEYFEIDPKFASICDDCQTKCVHDTKCKRWKFLPEFVESRAYSEDCYTSSPTPQPSATDFPTPSPTANPTPFTTRHPAPAPSAPTEDPICFPVQSFPAGDADCEHPDSDAEGRAVGFDHERRDNDGSWYFNNNHGSRHVTKCSFPVTSIAVPCSSRHAFVTTYVVAVDDINGNNDEVIAFNNEDRRGGASRRLRNAAFGDSLPVVSRYDFPLAHVPVQFHVSFTQANCDADSYSFGLFNGVGAPVDNDDLPARASIVHYSTTLERCKPVRFRNNGWGNGDQPCPGGSCPNNNAENKITANSDSARVDPSNGHIVSDRNSEDYMFDGPFVSVPAGPAQVEWTMSLDDADSWSSTDPVARVEIYSASHQTLVGSKLVYVNDFPNRGELQTITHVVNYTLWANDVSFRVFKFGGFQVSHKQVVFCCHTNGAACSDQEADSCPTAAPTSPPTIPTRRPTVAPPLTESPTTIESTTNHPTCSPTTQRPCLAIGVACEENSDCCEGTKCHSFSYCSLEDNNKICVPNSIPDHMPHPAPTPKPTPRNRTPRPTYAPAVAYVSVAFDIDIQFWQDNHVELNTELSETVRRTLKPYFSNAQLGELTVNAGSVVASVPWLNVPSNVQVDPSLLDGVLPSNCLSFPRQYLLSQLDQTSCTVSFLRLCGNGALIDWSSSCPAVVPAPTEDGNGKNHQAKAAALASSRTSLTEAATHDYALIIGLVGAIILFSMVFCCLVQQRRQRRVKTALKVLKDTPMEDSFAGDQGTGSFASSGSISFGTESEISLFESQIASKEKTTDQSLQQSALLMSDPLPNLSFAQRPLVENVIVNDRVVWDDLFRVGTEAPALVDDDSFRASDATDLSASVMEGVWNDTPISNEQLERVWSGAKEADDMEASTATTLSLSEVWDPAEEPVAELNHVELEAVWNQ